MTVSLHPIARQDAFAVLDITKWFGTTSGGVKTYLEQKSLYVRDRPELRHVVVVPGEEDDVVDGPGTRQYRLKGPRIPAHPPYRFLLATRSLEALIEHERPDVVEVGSPFFVPWLTAFAARRLRPPLVGFYHSSVPRWFGLAMPNPPARLFAEAVGRRYLRRLVRLFDLVVVSSDFASRDLREIEFEQVVRIPLGVDLERFHPGRRAQAERTRRALGVPPGPMAAYVGRLASDKDVDVLLEAWRRVERETGATLVLVGDGPEAAALRSACLARSVRWAGYVADRDFVADVLAAADLYVSPSAVETFGLASLEALASGTCVLSSDRGAVPEMIRRSGAGALFRAGEPDDLADHAIAMLRAGACTKGQSARVYAERNHAWPVVFDRLFEAYRGVARS